MAYKNTHMGERWKRIYTDTENEIDLNRMVNASILNHIEVTITLSNTRRRRGTLNELIHLEEFLPYNNYLILY